MNKSLSELLAELGKARQDSNNAYERYKELKGIEDALRYELDVMLHEQGLKSAKGQDFTASLVETPRIVIKHEQSVIDWLREAPNIETDQYLGIKSAEFQSLAKSLLKNTGEVIPGTEVEVKESLAIKSNPKKKGGE